MGVEHVYVISDLHLGGSPALEIEPGRTVGFQMCPPAARRRLARLIHRIRTVHAPGEARLVINGDFVDFLAEADVREGDAPVAEAAAPGRGWSAPAFSAFTGDAGEAVAKLERAIAHTDGALPAGERVFEALTALVGAGHHLTLLLGNHDLELSLPPVRRALLERLTGGQPARVEFVYDGEAWQAPGLLIEHGNRYDGWNAVSHGALRAFRSRASRGEPASSFAAPPGSELVARIMNGLKARYPFIDLLKPENEAVIPLLVALEPELFTSVAVIAHGARLGFSAWRIEPRAGRLPESEAYTIARRDLAPGPLPRGIDDSVHDAGDAGDPDVAVRTERLLEAARQPVAGLRISLEEAETGSFLMRGRSLFGIWAARRGAVPDDWLVRVRRAWVDVVDTLGAAFDLTTELPRYEAAARRLAGGERIVVFGHTHLAKRIELAGGGLYLNTGTWCPTVRVPTEVADAAVSDADALPATRAFVDALCAGVAQTGLRTTLAHIEVGDHRTRGELLEYADDGTLSPVRG